MSGLSKLIKIDGRTGEGGGQLVRVAVALSSLTGKAIQIDNIRGNRNYGKGKRPGGLKAQHVSCIKCLAEATNAAVTGLSVGSTTTIFAPKLSSLDLKSRRINIKAESASSILLVFQAILPFLIFAGNEKDEPIKVIIEGGTNVSFSLSFEYLDQVLLPALERFGIFVDRKLEYRGWSHGTPQIGSVKFTIHPLKPGQLLTAPSWPLHRGSITKVAISLVVPKPLLTTLKAALQSELSIVFPNIPTDFVVEEDSRHPSRIYTFLVAHTSTGLRFGTDWLYDGGRTKEKSPDTLSTEISQRVVDALDVEVRRGGVVDEYLQDQLVVFQALAEGMSRLNGTVTDEGGEHRRDKMDEPFGEGSMHTQTARWVTGLFLDVKWFNKGSICEGVGWKTESTIENELEESKIK